MKTDFLRYFAIYQIITGIFGFIALVTEVYRYNQLGAELDVALQIMLGFLLFGLGVMAGFNLLKKQERGIVLSYLNQSLQLIQFSLNGFTFQYLSGAFLLIGLKHTPLLGTNFDAQIAFSSLYNFDVLECLMCPWSFSINVTAILLITLLTFSKNYIHEN